MIGKDNVAPTCMLLFISPNFVLKEILYLKLDITQKPCNCFKKSRNLIKTSLFNEKIDFHVTSLTPNFFIINFMFLRQILKNECDLINIFKLCINISLVQLTSKLI